MLIPYRTGRYGRNSSYRSMNRYRNTFKMYRSRYRLISDNTGRTGVYRTFRPKKRNLAGTKTKRKNRRNAWFEQITVQQVSSYFFFFFLLLVCCPSPLLWFLLFFAEQLLCDFSFFVLYLIWNFLSPFTCWKCWKLYIFFNERWAEWFSLSFFLSVLSPTLCDALIASHQWKLFFFFFLSSNFLVFNIKKCTEMTYYINIFFKKCLLSILLWLGVIF